METSTYSDRPPTYQQALNKSHEQLPNQNIQFEQPNVHSSRSQTRTVAFRDKSLAITCPVCHALVMTNVQEENGALTFLLCILIMLIGGFLGCCLIPFCISSLKDKIHYCPRCHKAIGRKAIL